MRYIHFIKPLVIIGCILLYAMPRAVLGAARGGVKSVYQGSVVQLDFSDLTSVLDTAGYVRSSSSCCATSCNSLCNKPSRLKSLLKLIKQMEAKQSEMEDTTEAIEIRTNSIEQKACTIAEQLEQVLNKVNDIGETDETAEQQLQGLAQQVGELATLVLALLAQ